MPTAGERPHYPHRHKRKSVRKVTSNLVHLSRRCVHAHACDSHAARVRLRAGREDPGGAGASDCPAGASGRLPSRHDREIAIWALLLRKSGSPRARSGVCARELAPAAPGGRWTPRAHDQGLVDRCGAAEPLGHVPGHSGNFAPFGALAVAVAARGGRSPKPGRRRASLVRTCW